MKSKQTIDVVSHVHKEEKTRPITGVYSPDFNLTGWRYERDSIRAKNESKMNYGTFVGGQEFNLEEGTFKSDWNSIVADNISFHKIEEFRLANDKTWTPLYSRGVYSIYWNYVNLFSSYHYSGVLSQKDNYDFVELEDDCVRSSIEVAIWTRDENYIKYPYLKFQFVSEFETIENSQTRAPQYVIEGALLKTNKSKNIKIGSRETDSESVKNYWEEKGIGNSNGRSVFTKYFPIKKESLEIVAVDKVGNTIVLKEKENIYLEDDSEYIYHVDYDLGIIQIGGQQDPELILIDDLDADQATIKILNQDKMKTYPESGYLKIDNEIIFYKNKNYNTFFDCTRGVKGTASSFHKMGTYFQGIKNGKSLDSRNKIYCKYEAIPKVRYEVSDKTERFANNYGFLNLKPIYNVKENGIIQISSVDRNVFDIKLEVDADLLQGNTYGPLYYGTDFRQFTATALDRLGNPVPDIEITIKFSYGPGYLSYSLREFTGISNSEGEIYTLYGVPYDWESVSKRVLSVVHEGQSTKMELERLPVSTTADTIQLYQVLKQDPILGTDGRKMDPWIDYNGASNNWSVTSVYNMSLAIGLNVENDIVSKYEGGSIEIHLIDPATGTKKRFDRSIAQAINWPETTNSSQEIFGQYIGIAFLTKESIPSAYSSWDLDYIVVFEKEAVRFSEINMNGQRRVMYEWRNDIKHPISNQNGAYFPVRPSSVSGNFITFLDKKLPLPEPNNVDSNIGGYLAVCSDVAEFYAECVDPISGNIIKSNKIKVRIDIPEYLNGVSNQTGLPIPYGFKIASEGFTDASGIGGATFLTINPFDYNLTDLMLEIM